MNINSLKINQGFNESFGLYFKIELRGGHYYVDLLIREIQGPLRNPIQIRMEPDTHKVPHIHISKRNNRHFASFSLDGSILAGERGLSSTETKVVREWLSMHGRTLHELWACLKNGDTSGPSLIKKINETWEYQGCIFKGKKPQKEAHYPDLIVWYNGCLTERNITATIKEVRSTGSMCVYYQKKSEKNSGLKFKSDADLQISGTHTRMETT